MLTFTKQHDNGTTDLWLPGVGKTYAETCVEGRARATELVGRMRETQNPTILGHIIGRIVELKEHGGLEIGFYQVIAEHLT